MYFTRRGKRRARRLCNIAKTKARRSAHCSARLEHFCAGRFTPAPKPQRKKSVPLSRPRSGDIVSRCRKLQWPEEVIWMSNYRWNEPFSTATHSERGDMKDKGFWEGTECTGVTIHLINVHLVLARLCRAAPRGNIASHLSGSYVKFERNFIAPTLRPRRIPSWCRNTREKFQHHVLVLCLHS